MPVHLNCKYLVVMEITKFKKGAIIIPMFRKGKWHDLENFTVKLSYKSIGSINGKVFQGSIKKQEYHWCQSE